MSDDERTDEESAERGSPEADPPAGVKVRSEKEIAKEGAASPALLRGASLTVLVLVVACLGGAGASWIASLLRDEPEPDETLVIRPTADVVVAVRDLARLESASYHVERVIDLSSHQRRVFGLVQAEDSILLVAAADVVAGVDLTEMQDGDVVIDPEARRATITLPPARILSASLDNDRTYVHRRDTDLLARRHEALETQARQEAERTLEQAAIETGILERAQRNAARTVETLVRSLGYDEVEVRFREREE
jgi:hypothetical protein